MVETLKIGTLQIKNSIVYIDGRSTENPTLIGLALLDSVNKTSKNIDYVTSNQRLNTYLKQNKKRQTPERSEILKIIHKLNNSFEAETIFNEMKKRKFVVSLSTVYNTIKLLVTCEILKEKTVIRKPGTIYTKTVFLLNTVN